MRVIAFVTQKGGSGKTTLCLNLAVAAEQAGKRALIVDLDPQGTAEAWYQDREAARPRLSVPSRRSRPRVIELARRASGLQPCAARHAGRDEPGVAAAIRAADFCIVPCRPTPADMKATPATVATIRRLAKPAGLRPDPDAAARLPDARGPDRARDAGAGGADRAS